MGYDSIMEVSYLLYVIWQENVDTIIDTTLCNQTLRA